MTPCERVSSELARVMYGEAGTASISAELSAHLNVCERCAETCGLLGELSAALRPAPLSARSLDGIRAKLDLLSTITPPRRAGRRPALLRPLWSAAAAAMLLLAWLAADQPGSPESDGAAVLSADESAAVAEALAVLYVDDSSDVQLEYASERLDSLRQQLGANDRMLPWTADDDWDLPRPTSG